MKRTMKMLAAICLAAGMLAACQGAASPGKEAAPDAAAEGSAMSQELPPVEEMMEALAGYQEGTAGSSLKRYIAACGVLNFAEEYTGEEGPLREAVDAWLAESEELEVEAVREGWPDVQDAAKEILTQGTDALAEVLEDAGNPNRHDSYHQDRYDRVAGVLDQALQEE